MSRPNVLLIVFDTARADGFSPYARDRRTPTVGQLASNGTAYANAFAPSCWTLPSHASMFLGAPPRSIGLSRPPDNKGALCAPVIADQIERWLPEVMRRAGYRTAAVTANLWISATNGFAQGFDDFHEIHGERVSQLAFGGVKAKLKWYLHALRARTDDGALAVESLLGEWMRTAKDGPFFWFVNLIECHSPYMPPKPFNDLGPVGRLAASRDSRRYQTLEAVLEAIGTGVAPPRRSLARMRHLYDRSIELMDAWLARVVTMLEHAGVLEDTTIIITSDHGENFGECGLIGHGGSLDDRLLRVPLVVSGPGAGPATPAVTSLNDLPRLVAGAAGLDDHPWGDVPTPGLAVAQYDGPVDLTHPKAALLDTWDLRPEGFERLTERFTACTDGALKLVRSKQGDKLYDLTVDPLERDVVEASAYPDVRLEPLRRALDDATTQAWDPEVAEAPETPPEETAALEERMKLLGYL